MSFDTKIFVEKALEKKAKIINPEKEFQNTLKEFLGVIEEPLNLKGRSQIYISERKEDIEDFMGQIIEVVGASKVGSRERIEYLIIDYLFLKNKGTGVEKPILVLTNTPVYPEYTLIRGIPQPMNRLSKMVKNADLDSVFQEYIKSDEFIDFMVKI